MIHYKRSHACKLCCSYPTRKKRSKSNVVLVRNGSVMLAGSRGLLILNTALCAFSLQTNGGDEEPTKRSQSPIKLSSHEIITVILVSLHSHIHSKRQDDNSLSKVLIIRRRIGPNTHIPRRIEHRLGLGGLCLLPALLRSLLLLHLLIAQRRQTTRNLLDLLARQVL
jgi:hypothetical protein